MASLTGQVPTPVATLAAVASKASVIPTKPIIAAAVTAATEAPQVDTLLDAGDTCRLLPGFFGIAIQLMLCVTSITIVFLKYTFESPKRPYKVFLMDFVTMMCGSGTVHILNILSSILINRYQGSSTEQGDECNLYFMTTLFDSTFGIYIEYRLMRYLAIRKAAYNYLQLTRKSVFKPTSQELENATRIATVALVSSPNKMETYSLDLEFNNNTAKETFERYDTQALQHEPAPSGFWPNMFLMVTSPVQWGRSLENKEFVDNLTTWLTIVCGLKLITIVLFTLFTSQINTIGNFLLMFLQKRHNMKLLFVMIAAPLVFNVFQYCVTDSILKINTVDHTQMQGAAW